MIEFAQEAFPKLLQVASSRRFGVFEVNLQARELRKHGTRVKLSGHSFEILALLLERPGEIVTRDQLRARLWPADTFVDFEHGLNTAVKKLRATLGDSSTNSRYVETIPRVGYRLVAPIETASPKVKEADRDAEATRPPMPDFPPDSGKATPSRGPLSLIGKFTLAAFLVITAALVLDVAKTRDRLSGLLRPASIPASAKASIAKSPRSIAVLPLENLSGDREQDYFAEGMTDELTTDLAQFKDLRVISRTSAMHYEGTNKTSLQIGKELGVDTLIEGTVERVGEHVRIRAQLIDCISDRHLWAKSYDREFKDVLALQSELARDIVEQTQGNVLSTQPLTPSADSRPINPNAYEAYLKGRYFWNKRTPEDLKKSIEYFEQAIAQDPTFAIAYAGLADSYSILGSDVLPADVARSRARAAASKALELDSTIAEGHAALALVEFYYDWNWKQSGEEFQRAIKLNPNYATAHQWYSYHLTAMGRFDEAIQEAKRAQQIDPLSLSINTTLASRYYYARRYDEAIELNRRTLELDPNFVPAHDAVGSAYAEKGMWRETIDECQKELELSKDNPSALASVAFLYARTGRKAQARKIVAHLQDLSQGQYVSAFEIATALAALGDRDHAFVWFEKAYRARESQLPFLNVVPRLDALRSDPRFQDLLRRVGLVGDNTRGDSSKP